MIDAGVRELLDLIVRWVHVVAGIMWIGNSLLWNWLDRNLEQPDDARALGKIWLLHSGAFYRVEKTLLAGQGLPAPLHWFKWQAYTTWLSGALLLAIVFYATGGALLVGADARISGGAAIAIGAGLIVMAWPVYNLVWRSALVRLSAAVSAVLGLALILGVAYALSQVFSGRAAFLHVGAMLGTIMAGNVVMRIMPAQRQLVAAVGAGGSADPALADRAKRHSIHNNYMTFPVIALMLSSHFPGLYGQPHAWALLGVIVIAGAAVRHFMNIRFTNRRWGWGLAATVTAAIAVLYVGVSANGGVGERANGRAGEAVAFADVRSVLDRRCTVCHSAAPADRTFGVAPGGIAFDSPERIHANAERIMARAVVGQTMPPANKTSITDDERDLLRRWIEAGAEIK